MFVVSHDCLVLHILSTLKVFPQIRDPITTYIMAGKKQGKKPRGKFIEQQKDFLLSKMPEFREAQQAITTPAFFAALYIEWFLRWPIASDGSQADSEASSPDNPDVKTPRQEMMAVSTYPHR